MSSSFLDARVLPGRTLLGWMSREQAVQFLQTQCVSEPPLSAGVAAELWRTYRSRVEDLPSRPLTQPRTFPLDEADREAERQFLDTHAFASDIAGFVRIDPMALQIHQLQVITQSLPGLHEKFIAGGWMKTALSDGDANHSIRWSAQQNQLVFELPSGEFFLTAPSPPDAHMRIAPLPAYVSVAQFEGRTLLVNGYHRTFAWLDLMRKVGSGVEAETGLLYPLSTNLPFPIPPDAQTSEVLAGPRPPLFADFFDDHLALPVSLRRNKHYEMRVKVEIVGVQDGEPEPLPLARPAHA